MTKGLQKKRYKEVCKLSLLSNDRIFNVRNIAGDIYSWHDTQKPEVMFTIISHVLHVTKIIFEYANMFTIHKLKMKGSRSSIHNVKNDLVYKCYELNYGKYKKKSLSTALYMLDDLWNHITLTLAGEQDHNPHIRHIGHTEHIPLLEKITALYS